MASGLTRTEQYALIGVIGLITVGMVIHGLKPRENVAITQNNGQWEKLGEVGADGHSTIEANALKPTETPDSRIDINKAGPVELDRLPGIGAVKARAMIDLREKLGGFRSIEQLEEVKGIGKTTIEKLRPLVKISPTTATAMPAGLIE